jgi:hypothetical protein
MEFFGILWTEAKEYCLLKESQRKPKNTKNIYKGFMVSSPRDTRTSALGIYPLYPL